MTPQPLTFRNPWNVQFRRVSSLPNLANALIRKRSSCFSPVATLSARLRVAMCRTLAAEWRSMAHVDG